MSKQINGKMIEVPNMYRSHNTNYVQTIDLVLLNILYLIINLTRLKDAYPLQRQFVIQSSLGEYRVSYLMIAWQSEISGGMWIGFLFLMPLEDLGPVYSFWVIEFIN